MIDVNLLHFRQISDLKHWDEIIKKLPGAHLLQTREWYLIKAPIGWSPLPYIWEDENGNCLAACLILKRQINILPPLIHASILYAPKGPLLDWIDPSLVERILIDLKGIARSEKSLFIKIDPDVIYGTGVPGTIDESTNDKGVDFQNALKRSGWHFSDSQIQFRNSVIIDLKQTDDQVLGRMKQKTRYNIRLAEKKGVVIRRGDLNDSAMLYKMYAETSLRNGFTIRERQYYERVWKILFKAGMLEFLVADYHEKPIAALILFLFSKRAYYFYGMSGNIHRELMPTYLLQWEAIKTARKLGCEIYDLWGAPDVFNDRDPMWGVYRFKEGLGGQVIRTIGAWDYPVKPFAYNIYVKFMPRVLAIMRSRGKSHTLQEVG
ncbi:MAG: peptidoglycan bridge formation glycyltransferase FemA/FemB family protein [Anaerolineaceae bacterium]